MRRVVRAESALPARLLEEELVCNGRTNPRHLPIRSRSRPGAVPDLPVAEAGPRELPTKNKETPPPPNVSRAEFVQSSCGVSMEYRCRLNDSCDSAQTVMSECCPTTWPGRLPESGAPPSPGQPGGESGLNGNPVFLGESEIIRHTDVVIRTAFASCRLKSLTGASSMACARRSQEHDVDR